MAGASALRLARLLAAKPALPRPMAAARDVMVDKNEGYVSVFGRSTLLLCRIGSHRRMPNANEANDDPETRSNESSWPT